MPRLIGSATQGSADAFVSAAIQTALTGQTRQAYQVKEIAFEWPKQLNGSWTLEAALARRPKTAMPNITDIDVMTKMKQVQHFSTSGVSRQDPIVRYQPPADMPIIIVEDPIYLLVDSDATTLANTVVVVIEYELVTISEIDRLNLVAQSLLSA